MLVRNCFPGDCVVARGWDVRPTRNLCDGIREAYLTAHNLHHKNSKEAGQFSTLLYVGPTSLDYGREVAGVRETPRRLHHFLTEEGMSISLHGSEFRCLEPCKV